LPLIEIAFILQSILYFENKIRLNAFVMERKNMD